MLGNPITCFLDFCPNLTDDEHIFFELQSELIPIPSYSGKLSSEPNLSTEYLSLRGWTFSKKKIPSMKIVFETPGGHNWSPGYNLMYRSSVKTKI